MEFSQEDILNNLYARCLKNEAMILTLKTMLFSYIGLQNKKQADSMDLIFDEQLTGFLKLLLESGEMREEYLNYLSDTAVQDLKRQLGL